MSKMLEAYKDRIEEIEQVIWELRISSGTSTRIQEIQKLLLEILPEQHKKLVFELEEISNRYVCESTDISYRSGMLDGLAIGGVK